MMDVRDQLNDRGARGPKPGTSASAPASSSAAPNGTSPAALDPDQFRSILGRFASGVTVVTAVDAGGEAAEDAAELVGIQGGGR